MVSLHINHLPMELNERTDLTTLAGTVKKKVNGLIGVYSLLIFGTILLFLVVTALILVIMWGLYSSGNLHSRIFAYGMIVVVAAGYCLWVVLKPVFKIFRRPKEKGVEIGREGHEELFALIDEVVKEVDCLQPKQVRLSNECNAYVYYPNLFGYLSKGRQQNLTIGYPLVYGLNKTELKAILAHEFGHFTQKSVSTNRTANLSEFICASIARSIDEAEQSEDSYAKIAKGFVRFAGKVMTKQYHRVAPYNGILSRAQEFDADHYSQIVAGTDAAVSAQCKLDYLAERWNGFMNLLYSYQRDQKRSPEDVMKAYESYFKGMDGRSGVHIAPEVHLTEPQKSVESRLGSADKEDTHPSTEERVAAILSYPVKETVWDDAPATEYVDPKTASTVIDSSAWEIKQMMDPGATVFDRKKDITADEISALIAGAPAPHLSQFGPHYLFFREETDMTGDSGPHPEYGTSPFTEGNAAILEEFYVAEDDMDTLEGIANENSPKTRFRYLDRLYDGTTVPLDEHKAYFSPLQEKAFAIARHCNWWLDRKAESLGETDFLHAYRVAALVNMSIQPMIDAVKTIHGVAQGQYAVEGGSKYVAKVEDAFKARTAKLIEDRPGGSALDYILSFLGAEEEDVKRLKSYFFGTRSAAGKVADSVLNGSRTSMGEFVDAFSLTGQSVDAFTDAAWDRIRREFINA